ncbi:hypothetical protein Poli38472_006548 [Pythium oligandrum]|uniref:Tudor domain-containing protein n=1 Tax=Pythium oligandrum TaxID=41045 RepID=A0A8K1C509_PYTOL|nr:hypothetical protein Poli38472_006548 [Pythium oligandrum]|eukprot:TMW56538.1 hypothetical protein Poli38472_006548 [Pythium oligandrum]
MEHDEPIADHAVNEDVHEENPKVVETEKTVEPASTPDDGARGVEIVCSTPLLTEDVLERSKNRSTSTASSPTKEHEVNTLEAILAMSEMRREDEIPQYEPLRGQWHYGQAVFARHKKTPYYYSGNIATYLGAGLFMIIFDDGSLNYRVKREDIVLRPTPKRPRSPLRGDAGARDPRENAEGDEDGDEDDDEIGEVLGERSTWYRTNVHLGDKPLMVDFSVSPPRQVSHGRAGYDLIDEAMLDMKQLECGVAYEDDSTQVSDSDESSEEDMTMTPWQQMTQTFGMGGRHAKQRASRRSSISSLSQIERLSMNSKSMNNILASPKSIRQIIQDYLAKKTKKVQPSTTGMDPLCEIICKMEIRCTEMRARPERTLTMRSIIINDSQSDSGASRRNAASPSNASSNNGSPRKHSAPVASMTSLGAINPTRVVFQREQDGTRAYGTIRTKLPSGEYEVVAEGDQTITVQVLPQKDLDFLPSIKELQAQIQDLQQQSKRLYAGRKVQVNLYPGTRFSGPGVITLEDDSNPGMFHVLLHNRIRLVNVPAEKLVPLKEKKREVVCITDDQFLVCSGKHKVHIGDQVFVRCQSELEGGVMEEKLGVLNGVYSNKTAAIDFADGSTGYEIPPQLIMKRKRLPMGEDIDVLSLKNAVLMQAASSPDGYNVDVGYQVKADHPRRASVESCVVIRKHPSSACDLRFPDGTISFNVFPSQMILDQLPVDATQDKAAVSYDATPGEYILAWSSRFGRYCSANVANKTGEGASALYTLVFDYGEQKEQVPSEKIVRIDEPDAISPTQKLTNYSIDTIGFEILPETFTVGEAVLARVRGTTQYFNGTIELVREKERTCIVVFDSAERDEHVKFSSMFSVDSRHRFKSLGQPSGSSSNGTAAQLQPELSALGPDMLGRGRRRHSASSVGSVLMSVAGSFFRARKLAERTERRGSHLVTEMGANIRPAMDEQERPADEKT